MKKEYSTLESGKGFSRQPCHCSRRCKFIICGAVSLPFLVVAVLIVAVLINTAALDDPFKRMRLYEGDTQFMSDTPEERLERAWHLADAIKIATISYGESNMSLDALVVLNSYLETTFPALHSVPYITFTQISNYSRLYRVEGSEDTANPYLLTAHLDVVPAGDLDSWTSDPFTAGVIDEGKTIFGRGAIDDKHSVVGILEALEYKVKNDDRPKRTFYIGFGHDEEISGLQGAAKICEELRSVMAANGEKLDFLLDEGMFVMQDVVPGVAEPLIYIGVAEKGWSIVELTVRGKQIHSSIPPKESTIGILSNAIRNLERHHQPSRFGKGPEIDTIKYTAPHANFLYKMALGNLWLTGDIVSSIFASESETDAVQRTTTAVTIFNAGIKDNVVPGLASAIVNHRLHPWDDDKSVLKHDAKVINDDRVEIVQKDYRAPTLVSPYDTESMPFQIIANSALEVYPQAHPVPGTMVANTDTLHYTTLTDRIYRFSPVVMSLDTIGMFHGIDEKLSVEDYNKVVQFYYRMMANADFDVQKKISVS